MDLLNLEQQRLALETNLNQLRQNLKHWHIWEAEYEGLKEEIASIHGEVTRDELTRIAKTYGGELVNEKEVRQLAGLDKDSPRSAEQIVGVIERRQEYVQKNIEIVQRRFFDAEAKSEELAFAAASQGGSEQSGLPLTEIHEELDEEGNVISSSLSQPEEHTARVVDSLRKTGLSEKDLQQAPTSKPRLEDLKPAITNVSPPITPAPLTQDKCGRSDGELTMADGDGAHGDPERPPLRKKSVSFAADTKAEPEPPRPESEDGRKSVSFAKKVAVMPAAPAPDTRSVSFSPKVEEIPPQPLGPPSPNVQAEAGSEEQTASEDVSKPIDEDISMNEDKKLEAAPVVIPEDESPEDAQTRREMLEYHLNEVGNVVAQIDLDEADMEDDPDADDDDSSSYFTSSEYLGDEDTPYTTGLSESEGEEEDSFGRTKKRVVSEDYRDQMQDLEQRLIGNLGPAPNNEDIEDADSNIDPKDVHRLVIRNKRNSTSSASSDNSEKKSNSKKRVSFAESLDVTEPAPPPLKAQKLHEGENVAPVAETISERTTATHHSLPGHMSPQKTSRFMKARAAPITHTDDSEELPTFAGSAIIDDSDSTPSGPPAATLADTLFERTPAATRSATAPSPDDIDPVMERRELAAEYYRRRNDMIRQQGGFKADENEDEVQGPLMEERDGKVRKVSRFKAARIKPSLG